MSVPQVFKVLQIPKSKSRISNAKFPMAFPFSAVGVAPRIMRLSFVPACAVLDDEMTGRRGDGATG